MLAKYFSWETIHKFPIVFVFMFISLVFVLLKNHDIDINNHKELALASVLSIVSSTSLYLYFQNKEFSYIRKSIYLFSFAFLNFIVCLLLFKASLIFYIGFVLLSLSYFRFISQIQDNKYIIEYIIHGFYSIVFSIFSSLILFLGTLLIFESLEYLFSIEIENIYRNDIWAFIFIIIFPFLFLSNILKFNYNNKLLPMSSMLIRNILVPLVFVYALILYAYFIKILIIQEVPKGELSWMICTFLVISLLVKLLLVLLEKKNRFIEVFENYFYILILVPIGFLILSIYQRVEQYGITEARYTLMLFALWFVLQFFMYLIKKDFSFKYIFILLSILFFISTSAASYISINSQYSRFVTLLEEKKLLVDNKISLKNENISSKDLRSVIFYLSKDEKGLEKINVLLNKDFKKAKDILNYLKVDEFVKNEDSIHFEYETNMILDVKNYDIVLPFSISTNSKNKKFDEILLRIEEKSLILNYLGKDVNFDISSLIKYLKTRNIKIINQNNYKQAVITKDSNKYKLYVKSLNYYGNKLEYVQGFILIKK